MFDVHFLDVVPQKWKCLRSTEGREGWWGENGGDVISICYFLGLGLILLSIGGEGADQYITKEGLGAALIVATLVTAFTQCQFARFSAQKPWLLTLIAIGLIALGALTMAGLIPVSLTSNIMISLGIATGCLYPLTFCCS